ncbi:hypothetical protein NE237_012726 [Protea cynaroides]|uniref:Embryo sac development arrest 6 n=1 Tax=Protea cynaroides TaxID=273540 RepID=A0A9Q0H0C5_9MAGN|nr:hypothetical protein NE237_012726 [Protea cynaroides]
MSNHPRRVLSSGASRKRKERDGLDTLKASTTISTTTIPTAVVEPDQAPAQAQAQAQVPSPPSNRLLAGYLAHEFLTEGTLFGQKWDPARASAAPITASSPTTAAAAAVDTAETKKVANAKNGEPESAKKTAAHQSYAAVANLMKMEGIHIPGIVNPTQLSRWLQI